jgi:hypothetical protein
MARLHEQQSDAVPRTSLSLAKTLGSSGFDPATNIAALRIRETGASLRNVKSFGLDPRAFRLMSDLRIEGATGDLDYGRVALDLTVSHPIGQLLNRSFSAAITAGAGTSVGSVAGAAHVVSRRHELDSRTTRGCDVGNSYWLTRSEVGYGSAGFRRVAFFDLGWAGNRTIVDGKCWPPCERCRNRLVVSRRTRSRGRRARAVSAQGLAWGAVFGGEILINLCHHERSEGSRSWHFETARFLAALGMTVELLHLPLQTPSLTFFPPALPSQPCIALPPRPRVVVACVVVSCVNRHLRFWAFAPN